MSATPEPHRRALRNYLLDRGFQLKYTLLIVASGLLIFGAMGLLFYRKVQENTELASLNDGSAFAVELASRLGSQDANILWMLIGFWVLLGVMLFVVGILATHRIVGPVYVLDRYIQRIASGQPLLLRPLRRADEFQHVYRHVNELAEALRRERSEDIAALDLAIARLGPSAETAECVAALQRLASQKRAYLNALDHTPAG